MNNKHTQKTTNETIKRNEEFFAKLSSDAKENLKIIAQDFYDKFESRNNELTRQLSQEHSERLRYQDFLVGQMDLKAKMNDEKLVYHREETKELNKKLESTLASILKQKDIQSETEFKSIQVGLQNAQKGLEHLHIEFNQRLGTSKEHFTNKILGFESNLNQVNSMINKECETIGDIIREEITARFSSDVYIK